MWNVEWLGAHMRIFQKAAELRPFNLLKWLITGNNPFRYISLESLGVECLFLVIWSVYESDKGLDFTHCVLLRLFCKQREQVCQSCLHSSEIGVGCLGVQDFFCRCNRKFVVGGRVSLIFQNNVEPKHGRKVRFEMSN
jgi:hypothetical protein